MKENKLNNEFNEYLGFKISELILIVSTIKTFLKASDCLLYDEEFSLSDIQNMFDELVEKVKILDKTVEDIDNKAHEFGIM